MMTPARPDTWMPFYVGDYLRDTMHLTTEGHGAYMLLLMTSWVRGGALPDDDNQLSAIARVTPKRWQVLKPVLQAFFQAADGKWTHKRVMRELDRAKKLTKDRSAAGQRGAESRWQTHGNANGKDIATPIANGQQTDGPSQPPSPVKDSINTLKVGSALRARGASRVDFGKPENRQAYARQKIGPAIGWDLMMAAEDPNNPDHSRAVQLAKSEARKQRVTWHPPKAA